MAAKFLATHRCRQPVSRPERALEVKSSTQGTKQPSTIVLNIWVRRVSEGGGGRRGRRRGGSGINGKAKVNGTGEEMGTERGLVAKIKEGSGRERGECNGNEV